MGYGGVLGFLGILGVMAAMVGVVGASRMTTSVMMGVGVVVSVMITGWLFVEGGKQVLTMCKVG